MQGPSTIVHNIEMKVGAGGKIARAAGTYAQLVGKDAGWAQIKLGSGELRMVRAECMASIGAVSNPDNMNQKIGKAGRTRWLGKRPHNRGVVMNPVDHPHGGGEGKSKGGRHPVTPWGVPTLGKRTRSKHKESDRLIVRGRRRVPRTRCVRLGARRARPHRHPGDAGVGDPHLTQREPAPSSCGPPPDAAPELSQRRTQLRSRSPRRRSRTAFGSVRRRP